MFTWLRYSDLRYKNYHLAWNCFKNVVKNSFSHRLTGLLLIFATYTHRHTHIPYNNCLKTYANINLFKVFECLSENLSDSVINCFRIFCTNTFKVNLVTLGNPFDTRACTFKSTSFVLDIHEKRFQCSI